MPLYDPIVPTRYAAPLLEFVRRQRSARVAGLLAESRISPSCIDQQDAALTMAQFDRLICGASKLLGRSDLGFELGQRIDMYSHETLSLAVYQCVTLHDLLRFFERYWRLITTCFAVSYRRRVDRLEWIIRPAAGMSQTTLYAMEEVFALSFHTDYMRLFGNRRGLEVYLSIPPPPHVTRYRTLEPSRFYFEAGPLPQVRCVLPVALADVPLVWPKHGSGQPNEPQNAKGLAAPTTRCADWVALMLREADGVQPSRELLAELLGISSRTLSRNLAAEGIDFRRLANSIRLERASAMLSKSDQPVTEVAYRLGYGDVAAFTHAFRKAYGKSPRDYRNSCASNGSDCA